MPIGPNLRSVKEKRPNEGESGGELPLLSVQDADESCERLETQQSSAEQ